MRLDAWLSPAPVAASQQSKPLQGGYHLRNYAEITVQRVKRIFGNTLKARALPQ